MFVRETVSGSVFDRRRLMLVSSHPIFRLLHRARESQLWLMLFLVPQNTDLTVRCIVSIINAVQSSLKMGQPNKMIAFPSQNVKGWKRKISAKLSSGRFLPCCKSRTNFSCLKLWSINTYALYHLLFVHFLGNFPEGALQRAAYFFMLRGDDDLYLLCDGKTPVWLLQFIFAGSTLGSKLLRLNGCALLAGGTGLSCTHVSGTWFAPLIPIAWSVLGVRHPCDHIADFICRWFACFILAHFLPCYLFIGAGCFISSFSFSEQVIVLSAAWLANPFNIDAFFSKTSTGGRSLFIKWLPLIGLPLGVDEKFFSFISKVGSSRTWECSSCSTGTGEGAGDDRGLGLGVICTCTTYVK